MGNKFTGAAGSIILLILFSIFCYAAQETVLKISGVYDGYSYTAPYSLFTVDLREIIVLKSIHDGAENRGATQTFYFQDKEGNEYSILASFGNKQMDAHAFITKMVQTGKAQGKNVVAATTIDGEECLIAQELVKKPIK